MVRRMNRRFGPLGSTRNGRRMVPVFAIIALFLILGAAMVSNNRAGKSPTLAGSVPSKQAQSSYPTVDSTRITNLVLNVTTQQVKTNSGESYNFMGSGFTTNNSVTLHIKKPDNIELTPTIINTDVKGKFSFIQDASTFDKAGDYSYWIIDNYTNQMTGIFHIHIAESNLRQPTGLVGTYYVPAYGMRFVLDLYGDGTFYLMKPSNEKTSGRWTVKDEGILILDAPMLTYMMVPVKYQINRVLGNTTLTAPHYDQVLTFVKQ
jgi:hypothetical protein